MILRSVLILVCTLFMSSNSYAQSIPTTVERGNKGKMYFYWGWNRERFSNSTINFRGSDYDFTLEDVVATDRQSHFSLDTYFNPTKITIPQYNFRIGYFFNDKWDLSLGVDHMKYVVQQNQAVEINGVIGDSYPEYEGVYDGASIPITYDFLQFEHTDGLNYANVELRRSQQLLHLNKIKVNVMGGAGAGLLMPRTNTTLMGRDRHDEFHLSGYGFGAVAGVNLMFYDRFFIQSEVKTGFINMPDVRTTIDEIDRASHHFYYTQINIVFGMMIGVKNPS